MARHRDDDVAERVAGPGDGATLERLQGFADREGEIAAELAGGMEAGEIGRAETRAWS